MIVNAWPTWFRQLSFQDGQWPRSYCAVDTETTGFSPTEDLITEWGHVLVEDGTVVDRLSLVVNWTERDNPADHWVRERLDRVRREMEYNGSACHMSYAKMKTGMVPEKAFEFIRLFTDRVKARGLPFVLHNHNFDEKMLSANVLRLGLANGFTFGDRLLDTEGIEKASQIADNPRVLPRPSDSLRDYFLRVKYTRVTGVKSNMDVCVRRYGLVAKYGIDPAKLHSADADAHCCHLLMLEYGAQVTAAPAGTEAAPPAARRPGAPALPPPQPSPQAGLKRLRGQRRT